MEKFNPSDPRYKKVKDLPAEEQKNFVDVRGGGFVKKSAHEEYQNVRNAISFVGAETRDGWRSSEVVEGVIQHALKDVYELLGGEVASRRQKVLKILRNRAVEFPFHHYKTINSEIKDSIDAYFDDLIRTAEKRAFVPIKEQLRLRGHEGYLVYKDCGSNACECLYGEIDSQEVVFHTRMGDTEISNEVFKAYAAYAPSEHQMRMIKLAIEPLREKMDSLIRRELANESGPNEDLDEQLKNELEKISINFLGINIYEFDPQPIPVDVLKELQDEKVAALALRDRWSADENRALTDAEYRNLDYKREEEEEIARKRKRYL